MTLHYKQNCMKCHYNLYLNQFFCPICRIIFCFLKKISTILEAGGQICILRLGLLYCQVLKKLGLGRSFWHKPIIFFIQFCNQSNFDIEDNEDKERFEPTSKMSYDFCCQGS